jgi:HAD superfamily hydrolase (TIGR01662 family)
MMAATQIPGGIIFDLDGTLTDHPSVLGGAFIACMRKYGKEITDQEGRALANEMQSRVAGIESIASYVKTLHTVIGEQGIKGFFRQWKFVLDFIRIFRALTRKTPMFQGIPELLREIHNRGFKIAILTASNRAEVDRTFTEIRDLIIPLVDVILTRDDVPEKKPNPASVLAAIAKLGIDRSQAVMIGDSWHDIRAGKNAGIRTIAVLWGYGTRDNLTPEVPDYLVEESKEILDVLAKMNA